LRPKTDRGSLHFVLGTPPAVSRSFKLVEVVHHSAQCGSHPPKNSPRQQPYRVAAAVAPLPFGSLANRPSAEALNRSPCVPTSRRRSLHLLRRSVAGSKNRVVRALAPPTTTLCHRAEAPFEKARSPALCSSLWPKPSRGEIRFSMSPKRHCSPSSPTLCRVSCDSEVVVRVAPRFLAETKSSSPRRHLKSPAEARVSLPRSAINTLP